MAQYPVHSQQDAALKVNTVFGINNATTSTNAIDLGATSPFPTNGSYTVQISTTAGTNAANNKNVNITVQSATNASNLANFADIPGLSALVIPEVSASYAATTRNVALPPDATRRYIRLKCVTENAGGNPNDGVATLKLLF